MTEIIEVNIDFLYHFLKYAAPVLAAAMAIVTLLKKTRDDSGRITTAGRWFYALIIFFLLVGVVTQIADDLRQARSTAEQLKRNTYLLEQVVRGQYPLYNVRASYQLRVPIDLPGVAGYEQRLNGSMLQIAQQLSSEKYRHANDIRMAIIEPHVRLLFCQNSPFMPSVSADPEVARLVGALNVRVLLYRKRVKPEQWPLFVFTGTSAVQPDLEMWFSGGDRCIDYSAQDRQLILRDIGAATDPSQWQSSGDILSVLDLRGAQMIVDAHPRITDEVKGHLQ
ncbi:MAG: hypothetical protein AABN34_24660, partial [Acidobacteriota bacterium]